ncbi:MAG: tetratricopeptide repeat protein [Candidatus Limisoma sp.]
MKSKFILALTLAGSTSLACFADGYMDGVEYYQVGQDKNAKIVLDKTLNEPTTKKAEAYYYLGCIEINRGKMADANAYFDKGIDADPTFALNYVGKGSAALRNGDKVAAKDFFKQAEGINKKDAKIKVEIARAYYDANKVTYKEEYNDYLEKAKKANKKEATIYIFEGDMFADEKNYGESAGYYDMSLLFNDESPIAYVKYANTYFKINPSEAIAKLKQIVEKKPNSLLAQRELAEKFYENDQWTLATEEYKHVIDNPNHFTSDDERYVVLLYFAKKYDESLARAQAQLDKDPSSFLMKRMRFINAAQLEKWEDAERYAEPFFAAGSEDNLFSSNDYTTYGDVLKKLGKTDAALQAYEQAVIVNPKKTEPLKDLSSAYSVAAGDEQDPAKQAELYKKAAKYFQQYIDKADFSTNDMFVLAGRYNNVMASAQNADDKEAAYKSALDAINYVLDKVPDDYRIPQRKARIYLVYEGSDKKAGLAKDSYELMITTLEAQGDKVEASRRADALKEAYNYIASYYIANGDSSTAKTYYQKMLEVDPTNDALRQYISTMK